MADLADYSELIKTLYTDEETEDASAYDSPALGMVAKEGDFVGEDMLIPLILGNPQAVSSVMSKAQSQSLTEAVKTARFRIETVDQYGISTIDGKTILKTASKRGAFVAALKNECDRTMKTMRQRKAIYVYGDGWGVIGQIAASGGISGSTVTLENPDDVSHFEIGQKIVFAEFADTGALRNSGGTVANKIASIARGSSRRGTASVITFESAVASVAGVANGDYMFFDGDREDDATPARLVMAGFDAYNPYDSTAADATFQEVVRSRDRLRLAGNRFYGTGANPEEALLDMCAEGKGITHVFCHPIFSGKVIKSMGSRAEIVQSDVNPRIGFKGWQIMTDDGPVIVTPDINCPSNRVRGVKLSDWKIHHLSDFLHLIQQDGLTCMRQQNADGVEFRWRSIHQMACYNPANQIVMAVD